MPRLSRIYQKLFGDTANAGEIGKFGSLAIGSPATTLDPAQMQSLAPWSGGWLSAVVGGNSPAIEDMNATHYVAFYQLAYLMQQGIAEWDSQTTYYIGSMAQDGLGNVYVSIQNNNTNHALTDTAWWTSFVNLSTPIGSMKMYAGNTGSPPIGFLYCDGSSLSTTTYANLFSVIGYTYGGSGASFKLPDTRGIFVRGAGSQTFGAETYTGVLATKQNDQFSSHTHTGSTSTYFPPVFSTPTGYDPSDDGGNGKYEVTGAVNRDLQHAHSFTTNATGTGTETFPANISLNFIIKY